MSRCARRIWDTMSFSEDKARMRRTLKACEASSVILADFDDICRYRTTETAEELLRDICVRHGFVKPYERAEDHVVIRPYSLGEHHPAHHSDDSGDDPVAEQSYRRGYDQGANEALRMMKAGKPVAEIEERLRQIHRWRTQPIQRLHASPGCTISQELPDRWLAA